MTTAVADATAELDALSSHLGNCARWSYPNTCPHARGLIGNAKRAGARTSDIQKALRLARVIRKLVKL